MQQTTEDHHIVGVDIAASTFTAVWTTANGQPSRPTTFAQTPDGFTTFMQHLATVPAHTRIMMEATSSCWVALAVAVHEAGYQVSIVNPKHLHHYAKSLPRRSKTDALDASMIRQFGMERHVPRWTPPPPVYHELRQRLVARDALAEMRQQARNQRHALQQWPVVVPSVAQQFDAVEAALAAQIAILDAEIAAVLRDGAWAESAALLQGIAGIGPATTAWLMVATLNFELCRTPEAAVAYVGLDPVRHESGSSVWQPARVGRGGHARLRKALYVASLSAAQHNPIIRTFYQRLRDQGKPMKVARCAAARKLLHIAWAVATKGQPFDPHYHERAQRVVPTG